MSNKQCGNPHWWWQEIWKYCRRRKKWQHCPSREEHAMGSSSAPNIVGARRQDAVVVGCAVKERAWRNNVGQNRLSCGVPRELLKSPRERVLPVCNMATSSVYGWDLVSLVGVLMVYTHTSQVPCCDLRYWARSGKKGGKKVGFLPKMRRDLY